MVCLQTMPQLANLLVRGIPSSAGCHTSRLNSLIRRNWLMVCLQTMPQLANLLVRARILHLKRWLPHRVRLNSLIRRNWLMVCLQTMPQLANLLVRARILHLKRWLPHRVRQLVDKEELANGLPADDAAAGKSVGQGQNPPPQALAATQSPARTR